MTRHIAVVTDARYLPWASVVVRSVVESGTRSPVVVHVLHDESVGPESVHRLTSMSTSRTSVEPFLVDATSLEQFPDVGRFGRTVWVRCLLHLLFPDVDRMLYLDADTLVTAPLDPLLDHDLGPDPVGAVNDAIPERHWDRVMGLGLAEPADYFNSGVLAFDLDALRREDVVGRIDDVVGALGPAIHYPDQDVLNLLFPGRWHRLHPRFNAQNRMFHHVEVAKAVVGTAAWEVAVSDPVVVHFEGPDAWKPWHAASIHARRQQYRSVLGRTPWSDTPLVDDTAFTRALQRLPPDRRWGAYYTWRRLRDDPTAELRSLAGRLRRPPSAPSTARPVRPVSVALRPTTEATHVLHGTPARARRIIDRSGPFCPGGPGSAAAIGRAVDHIARSGPGGTALVVDDWRGGAALSTASFLGRVEGLEVHLLPGGDRRSGAGPAFDPAGMARTVATSDHPIPDVRDHRSRRDAVAAVGSGRADVALAVTTLDPADVGALGEAVAGRVAGNGLLVIDSASAVAAPPGFGPTDIGHQVFRRVVDGRT